MPSEPGEQLDEAKLAKGCGPKPEDNLIEVIEVADHAIALLEIAAHMPEVIPSLLGDETCALFAQLLERKRRVNRSFMKHVPPGDDLAFDTGLAQSTGGAVAVRDIQPLQLWQAQRIIGRYVDLS